MSTATDYFLYILLRPMFYLMHEGQIGLGSNAKLISFLSNIQSVHSLIEYKEIQLFLNVINGNNEFTLYYKHINDKITKIKLQHVIN